MIDLGHWFMDADLTSVVGVLRNFVPERMIRETGTMMRANIDDGDIFIGEFEGGAICSVQSSFVTVGNYPGIEVRVYGSEGALIARLVEEFGVMETLEGREARRGRVRRRRGAAAPLPARRRRARAVAALYYSNLTANFVDEILAGGDKNEGNFADAAWVQEVINAVEQSHHERGWVDLPAPAMKLELDPAAAARGLVERVDRGHVRERVGVRDDLGLPSVAHARCEVLDLEPVLVVAGRLDALPVAASVLELEPVTGSLRFTNASGTRIRPSLPSSSTSCR